jgi:hypothetical protein
VRRVFLILALVALAAPLGSFAAAGDPVITVPADMTAEAQNFSGAAVAYTASAVDRNNRALAVACAPASGAIFEFGTTTVTCTAQDSEGRRSTKKFKVTVVDSQAPIITVPGPQSVTTSVHSGKVVTYAASAADVVDGPVAVTCAPESGALFAVGTTTVSCTAQDRRYNKSTKTFNVMVVYAAPRSTKKTAMIAPKAGAKITAPPMLRWRALHKARFYNVQLFRRGHKVLTAWPSSSRLRLHSKWTYQGRSYRLKPGAYTWLVWPAYGSPARPSYGKLLGLSSFRFARR